jgi:hypothetical protein
LKIKASYPGQKDIDEHTSISSAVAIPPLPEIRTPESANAYIEAGNYIQVVVVLSTLNLKKDPEAYKLQSVSRI